MAGTLTMTDKQHAPAGVTILDEDGQPFATLPNGFVLAFESSNPAVADFVVGPDLMNGDITSGLVGACIISATITFPDQTVKSDSIAVTVTNSAPGVPNFTAGTPVAE